jgi:hypothetical protein
MIDGSGAPAAPMMLRCSLRQMFRKLRFQMIDDTPTLINPAFLFFVLISLSLHSKTRR